MKKRLLSLFLTLALTMGLTIPAFAADSTKAEHLRTISLTYSIDGHTFGSVGERFEGTDTASKWTLTYPDFEAWNNSDDTVPNVTEDYDGYYAVRQDTVFTVTNTSRAGQNSVIQIYLYEYTKGAGGIYEWTEFPHGRYLTKSGEFILDYASPDGFGGLVELKPGESCQFKLPEFNAGSIYKVDAEKLDLEHSQIVTDEWGNSYEEAPYYNKWAMFKVDNAAVDKYLAEHNAPAFSDVPAGEWYAAPVDWAVSKDITNGTGNGEFSPGKQCTHAQILTFLYRAARGQGKAEAADMDKAVTWAREKGMIDGSFNGSEPCTRADAVNYIWQALGRQDAPASSFTDVDPNASYAKAVDWAVANGVTNGTNTAQTEFSPDNICTRGHIVTFLHRAYVPEAHLK